MLSPERSWCWTDAKTIGLLIGFSRIILLSNMIVFRTISMPAIIFIEEAVVPLLFIFFDICWIHGLYTEKPKLLLPTLVTVTIEIVSLISLAIYQVMDMVYLNYNAESFAWITVMFAISIAIECFVWITGYILYKRMKKTQGFQNLTKIEYLDIV
ncbi:uncharacterized protein LOC129578832 [Sitodiplosis mosellana]|uniref:uncharacterized protein LOC129578832 n=1 Tax=Sitodiplosis mosellana TaxID=263140 RepID=UPI002444BF18|nr:uncharacterized protein LOC129578832 [Sitodiplosis mosellana]